MITLYKDVVDSVEADLRVEGTSLQKSKARLVLKTLERTYLFDGSIDGEGHVKIEVPALTEVEAERATAVIEVIADSTYFEAWRDEVRLANKKSIAAKSVSVNEPETVVRIDNIQAPLVREDDALDADAVEVDEPEVVPEMEMSEPETEEEAERAEQMNEEIEPILKSTVSDKNREFVRRVIESFNQMDGAEQANMIDVAEKTAFNNELMSWARGVFKDPESMESKLSMIFIIDMLSE